ncbi:DedA family protein [Allonocardiopsis opalescens]|uniref:Membrane-associated protein n=1 Tax=Allonocardiopsis opalescens TaxID=1144618 RepID=A0A2T0Q423_9ACTN|nr:DedA family protein [Allonocardiopsis opalescens]PRX98461.1 membrane-associated protein [Allonocardiopsis opalescens]
MNDFISGVLDALAGLPLLAVAGITTAFMVVETSALIGLAVPGDIVVMLAGTTATDPLRFASVAAAASLGGILGASGGYLIGRRFGPAVRRTRLGRMIGAERWDQAEALLRRRGGAAVAGSRFVAVIHALVPIVAGAVGMPYRRFIGWLAAGSVLWSLVYTGVGAAAGASFRVYGEQLGLVSYLLLAGVSVAAVAAVLLRGRAARRRAAREAPPAAARVPAGE